MAFEHAFFYDSNNGDRKYSAACFEHWLKKFFRTGVFNGDLKVIANSTMRVTVSPGYCNVDGKVRFFQEDTVLEIATAGATQDRIDSIVIERNDIERDITLKVVRGDYADKPVAKSLVRGGGIYQLAIAQIRVNAGAVKITQVNIKDTRMSLELCGLVAGTVSEMDFSQLKAQFDAFYEECEKTFDAWFTKKKSVSEDEFDTWFDEIKDQLSTDAAGNLQNQILVERERINNLARMEEGSIVTDAEKEIADVRVDANGITHPTAGDAVREQFNEANEKITKNTEISEEVKGARIVNGKSYKNLGLAINGLCSDVGEVIGGFDHSMSKIINDYMKGKAWNTLNINVGDDISTIKAIRDEVYPVIGVGCFVCKTKVKKDDFIEFKNTWVIENRQNYSDKLVITNKDFVVMKTINFNLLAQEPFVEIEEDGYMYLCSEYYDSTEVLFVLRRKNVTSPLVLKENEANEYLYDSIAGEEALQAILSGRQILVHVPNTSGDNYVATYSPVYMYQIPNYENQYLYLFHLKDEKETIDLSAIGAGKIEMPIYGQLKMLLSKTYNADPLK